MGIYVKPANLTQMDESNKNVKILLLQYQTCSVCCLQVLKIKVQSTFSKVRQVDFYNFVLIWGSSVYKVYIHVQAAFHKTHSSLCHYCIFIMKISERISHLALSTQRSGKSRICKTRVIY